MRASELPEITEAEIAWGETDGGVSINPEAVARRLNALLLVLQMLEARAQRHYTNKWNHVCSDFRSDEVDTDDKPDSR